MDLAAGMALVCRIINIIIRLKLSVQGRTLFSFPKYFRCSEDSSGFLQLLLAFFVVSFAILFSLLLDLPVQILSQICLELSSVFFVAIRERPIQVHLLNIQSLVPPDRVASYEFLIVQVVVMFIGDRTI